MNAPKAKPLRVECPTDSSVQKQWSMTYHNLIAGDSMTVKPVGMEVESMRTATTICRWEEISKFGITEKVVNGGIFSQKKITLI